MPSNNLPYQLGTILRDCRKVVDKQLKSYQLTRHEWLTIVFLYLNDYVTPQYSVRDYLGIDNSQLTKVLDKLEHRGIIIKHLSKEDRRVRIITVPEESRSLIDTIYKKIDAMNKTIKNCLSSKEEKQLFSLLARVQQHLQSTYL